MILNPTIKACFLSALCIIFIGIGCTKNCMEKRIGEVHFSERTQSYFPKDDSITFILESGETEALNLKKDSNTYHLCVNVICETLDPYKDDICEYIETDSKYYTYWDDKKQPILHLKAYFEKESDSSSDLAEIIELGLSHGNGYHSGQLIINDANGVNINPLTFQTDIDIHSHSGLKIKSYRNVYHLKSEDGEVMLKEGTGVVAFKTSGVWRIME